jgi:DNA-directed RNA polymerase specialized sigma24 family protein
MKEEDSGRIERLLALLLLQNMKGASKAEKAVQLSIAGFTPVEIADMLDTKPPVVHQLLYLARKGKRR